MKARVLTLNILFKLSFWYLIQPLKVHLCFMKKEKKRKIRMGNNVPKPSFLLMYHSQIYYIDLYKRLTRLDSWTLNMHIQNLPFYILINPYLRCTRVISLKKWVYDKISHSNINIHNLVPKSCEWTSIFFNYLALGET